jgi:hypothetical protein
MKKIYTLSGIAFPMEDYKEKTVREEFTCHSCDTCIIDMKYQILYQDAFDNYYCDERECVYEMLAECYQIEILDVNEEEE